MSNRQIQPVRSRDLQIIRQSRPRSMWSQVWTLALQPNTFFEALPRAGNARQWFWVAVLILALNGFSAVRQEALTSSAAGGGVAVPPLTDLGGGDSFPLPGGGGISPIPGDFGGSRADFGSDFATDIPSSTTDVSSTWITALISGSHIVLGWFVLALLLCEVPLFNGLRPSYGQNLQIAIWTSVPVGLMAGLQLIFLAAGGRPGAVGLSGLLPEWEAYTALPVIVQSLILSLASRFTVFWVWSLVLIYIGARTTLNGKHWAVALVLVVWVLVLVVVPVITGAIAAPAPPESALDESLLPEQLTLPDDGTGTLEEVPSSEGVPNAEPTSAFIKPGSATVGAEEVLSTPEPGG